MTHDLRAQEAALKATLQITRKATGKVETYHLIGTPVTPASPPASTPAPAPTKEA